MRMTLKEAKRSAEDGCICDKEEILKVLVNLLNTPLKEFPPNVTNDLRNLFACGLEWLNNIDDEEFGQYSYLDLICLAKITADTLIHDDPDALPCLLLCADSVFLQFIKKTSKYCTWTALFRSVNVKELLNVLDELAKTPHNSYDELLRMTDSLSDNWIKYDITPKSTVGELLKQTQDIIDQPWKPWHDLNDFAAHIRIGYHVIELLAFRCIIRAFNTSFKIWDKKASKRARADIF